MCNADRDVLMGNPLFVFSTELYPLYLLLIEKNMFITRKEGNVLFNDAVNTFYLRLYGVRHMVKYHTDRERGNPLSPHGLLFPINSKVSFICTIPQTG